MHDATLTETGKIVLECARRMVRLREEATRQIGAIRSLNAGTLTIAAHESAAVYLLPAPLRFYLRKSPNIKVRICRSRLEDIPRQVLDHEVDMGFVKDEPMYRGLKCVDVYADEMILIASPRHPLVGRSNVRIRDLGQEPFVVHHLCMSTEDTILRLFECNGTACRIVAELWSFENIKNFVQEDVGLAIVPRITVQQELRDGLLVEIPIQELRIPRRTLMISCEQGRLSESAQEMIRVVRQFNLVGKPKGGEADAALPLAAAG